MSRSVKQLFDLTGKTALVTGGSRGLGLQIAEALGESGARIVISSRKSSDLEVASAALKAKGINCEWIAADCGKEDDITKLVNETMKRLDSIDILVNNAGATWGAPAEDHPLQAWDKVMDLNVRGYFLLSQQVGKVSMIPGTCLRRHIVKQVISLAAKRGRIINVASIAGFGGNPKGHNTLAYNTSKGAVLTFTRALAGEWGQYNITVNSICPGFFPTKMTKATLQTMGERAAAATPLGRLGDDEDLKGCAVLFASEAGKHITGQHIAVDGGVSSLCGL